MSHIAVSCARISENDEFIKLTDYELPVIFIDSREATEFLGAASSGYALTKLVKGEKLKEAKKITKEDLPKGKWRNANECRCQRTHS